MHASALRLLAPLAGLLAAPLVLLATRAVADEPVLAGSVSFVAGGAKVGPGDDGPWQPLAKGAQLFQGQVLSTDQGARLELTMKDGSIVRLGGDSRLRLVETRVNPANRAKKSISLRLVVGRIWTNVSSVFGSESKFEIETANAVAGVRGTAFRVDRGQGKGTAIRVYEGNVLVSNKPIYQVQGATKSNRVQVAGPQEIGKRQWEELIAKALEQVKVAEAGEMSKPEAFDPAEDAKDEWVAWNREMDAKARPAQPQ